MSDGKDVFCCSIGGKHFASTNVNEAYQWKERVCGKEPTIYVKAVIE